MKNQNFDIFSKNDLKDAQSLKAEMMQTVYLENQGNKGFAQHSLPLEPQNAPLSGIAIDDFNNDDKKDLLVAGGNSWTLIKFSRYLANTVFCFWAMERITLNIHHNLNQD